MAIVGLLKSFATTLAFVYVVTSKTTTVTTISKSGTYVGKISEISINRETLQVREFLGIPYAKPPVGDLRFRKPVPSDVLASPYNATYHRAMCQQGGIKLVPLSRFKISEDCLYLNIYAPELSNRRRDMSWAVMIYIHGGAFTTGGSDFYVGDVISGYGDVIVVTFNYRLSIFGFFTTDNSISPGNYALWDQHLAIRWVHENIAAFRGDPDRVTIVGQSSGSVCALLQSLYPGNTGLFKRVIAESGTPVVIGSRNVGPINNAVSYSTTGHLVGCSSLDADVIVRCLRNLTDKQIMLALSASFYQVPFSPAVDGDFILAEPKVMLDVANTRYKHVQENFFSLQILIGNCNMEGASYMSFLWKALLLLQPDNHYAVTKNDFLNKAIPRLLTQLYGNNVPDMAIQAVGVRYSDVTAPDDGVKVRDMLLKLSTDAVFMVPMLKTANIHAQKSDSADTFVYELVTQSSMQIGKYRTPHWVTGANHGDETGFVFGFSRRMLNALNVSAKYKPSGDELTLSMNVMTLWTNFAKTGNPNHPVSVAVPEWPPYSRTAGSYLALSTNMTPASVRHHYGEPGGAFWLKFMPTIMTEPPAEMEMTPVAPPHVDQGTTLHLTADTAETLVIVLGIVVVVLSVCLVVSLLRYRTRRKDAKLYDAIEM